MPVSNSAGVERGSFSDADLKRRREQIRRGLTRANSAAVVILLIALGLSLAAIIQGLRAQRSAGEAEKASAQARSELWKAQLARAGAERLSGVAGRKTESLAAVTSAAAIRPSPELRDEAIAALALTDVTESGPFQPAAISTGQEWAFAPDFDCYARSDGRAAATVVRTGTGEVLRRFEGPGSSISRLQFSPDGELLAAAFRNGEVLIWNLVENHILMRWKCGRTEAHSTAFDFSPDSRLLVIACGSAEARILDLSSGKE